MIATSKQTTRVRAITRHDMPDLLRMADASWRVYIGLPPPEISARLQSGGFGFVAEDRVGLRGFMVVEPRSPGLAFFIGAGLRDTWHIEPFFDVLLPKIEQLAQSHHLSGIVHIGNMPWLVNELEQRGFTIREWIVALELPEEKPLPQPPEPAHLRPATPGDLQALLTVDTLAFDQLWHKPASNFDEALNRGDPLIVAEIFGRVVGYAWCELYRRHAHLTRLAVHPHFQGRGIGAQLLHRAITWARGRGMSRFTLNTQESNRRSLALYRRFGFVATRQRMPVLLKYLG